MTALLFLLWARAAFAAQASENSAPPNGGDSPAVADRSSLSGKVLCVYQGWFAATGDGAGLGWSHWSRWPFVLGPRSCVVDLWPDVSELSASERFPTGLRHRDGRPAEVFSSFVRSTVLRHFRWMREHGIDGVLLQRFGANLLLPAARRHRDAVLGHCREAAELHGRTYAVMYDLTGLHPEHLNEVAQDWRRLQTESRITDDRAYLHHRGRPRVGAWGVGFDDGRAYTASDARRLIEALAGDAHDSATASVVVGVPTGWRTLDLDSIADASLHDVILAAHVVSPWTVGRYRTPAEVDQHARVRWAEDLAWCRQRNREYLPVVFPGFSAHNRDGGATLDAIPRLGGRFLWRQIVQARRTGSDALLVATFDEVNEGTAILKCTNDPPEGRFVTYEGLPAEHYLTLAGLAGRVLRGELAPDGEWPLPSATATLAPSTSVVEASASAPAVERIACSLLAAATPAGGDLEILPRHFRLRLGEVVHYQVLRKRPSGQHEFLEEFDLTSEDPERVAVIGESSRVRAQAPGASRLRLRAAGRERLFPIEILEQPLPPMRTVTEREVGRIEAAEVLFVGHANRDGFDHTEVARVGIDRWVRSFKTRRLPVVYFVSDEYPSWYTEDRLPTWAVVSEGQDHRLDVSAERIVFTGGDFMGCLLRNVQFTLHRLLLQEGGGRPTHFVFPAEAIWTAEKSRRYPEPMVTLAHLFERSGSDSAALERFVVPFATRLIDDFPVLGYPTSGVPSPHLRELVERCAIVASVGPGGPSRALRASRDGRRIRLEFLR